VGVAIIRRKHDLGNSHAPDPGVGYFEADQLFQLLADAFRDSFVTMRVHNLQDTIAVVKAGLILLFCASFSTGAWGQPLSVYSEFARIDDSGKVTAPESPREILSPMLARNAFTSFQIVVEAPKGTTYKLDVAQNPENAVKVTLYRETGDRLAPVDLPVDGDGTQVFWMDVWRDGDSAVERIKVEPQLHLNDDWIIYPMEGRVMEAMVPRGSLPPGTAAPSDVMRAFLCAADELPAGAAGDMSIAAMRFRNAQQDLALAAAAPRADLQKTFGLCTDAASPDPEWYLRIRDFLFRLP